MSAVKTHFRMSAFILILSYLIMIGCNSNSDMSENRAKSDQSSQQNAPTAPARVREAAVAGLFYPRSQAQLIEMLDTYLNQAPDLHLKDLRGLVCPHAGYVYSGPIAAYGYKQLIGRTYKTVIVLAPSHYAWFKGASVCSADLYRTPLGDVRISPKARELFKRKPFVEESPCRVQTPSWAYQSSRKMPQEETPHTWEHSDEVQVPFLQRVLKDFEIIPIILGDVDPYDVAKGLNDLIDDSTLIVASSDLSHYLPYSTAKSIDKQCVQTICNMEIAKMRDQEACGKLPIMVLMHIASMRGWKPQLLDYRNSGDTAGDKSAVVGYASIAFTGNKSAESISTKSESLSKEDKKFLLSLARKTIKASAEGAPLPVVDEKNLSPVLKEKKACFVTLTKNGQLRGCIGHIYPIEPLYKAVIENARSAALYDTRFSPVRPDEVNQLEIEISILTEPKPLSYSNWQDLLTKLRPNVDGVILNIGGRRATFLPQVWEQLPDKEDFLRHLSLKAGANPDDWKKPDTEVLIYNVEHFSESQF